MIQERAWKKYRLMICNGVLDDLYRAGLSDSEVDYYIAKAGMCHCAVAGYLDAYPNIAKKYGKPGYRYYDILDVANPKLSAWTLEYSRKVAKKESK